MAGGPPAPERLRFRLSVLGLIMLSLLSVLVSRLWFLQVLTGDMAVAAATRNHVRIVATDAPRGRIYDRNGKPLVLNRPSLGVGVRREDLPKAAADRLAVLSRVAALLGITVDDIQTRLADKRVSPFKPVLIKEDVPEDLIFSIRERQELYPGIETLLLPVRTYPLGSLAAHVLGYVGEISQPELDRLRPQGYRLGDGIGVTGVERTYEDRIRGRAGLDKLEVDAAGHVLRTLGHQDAVPGADLWLTLDADVQSVAEESLALGIERARSQAPRASGEPFRAPGGAVVVMDVDTGEIVAMASAPTFDPARFVGGVDPGYYAQLNDPKSFFPLENRATQAAYPPGSTFKPITATAALASGAASAGGSYQCTSEFQLGDRVFHNWRHANAQISLHQALVESCDTVFYRFAAQWWSAERAAEKAGAPVTQIVQDWARRYGLGKDTGVDLPHEANGNVPDRAQRRATWEKNKAKWCARYDKTKDPADEDLCLRGYLWRGGDAINLSIGQGEVEATPLQMAEVYAAIANGGRVVTPHVALKVVPPGGEPTAVGPAERKEVGVPSGAVRYIQRALAQVPVAGTARGPFAGWNFGRVSVAAKTGTAEYAGKAPFSWFAAYAPADNPKYVAVAVVEEAGYGAQVAGPIVRRTMDKLFGFRPTNISYLPRTD